MSVEVVDDLRMRRLPAAAELWMHPPFLILQV